MLIQLSVHEFDGRCLKLLLQFISCIDPLRATAAATLQHNRDTV